MLLVFSGNLNVSWWQRHTSTAPRLPSHYPLLVGPDQGILHLNTQANTNTDNAKDQAQTKRHYHVLGSLPTFSPLMILLPTLRLICRQFLANTTNIQNDIQTITNIATNIQKYIQTITANTTNTQTYIHTITTNTTNAYITTINTPPSTARVL